MSSNKLLSFKGLLERATKDINMFSFAVKAWTERPEGYRDGYILILAFTNRFRGQRVLELMEPMLPAEDFHYWEALCKLWLETDDILSSNVLGQVGRIKKAIRDELIDKLDDLERILLKARGIANDIDLFNTEGSLSDEFEDIAQDFLLGFRDLTITGKEIKRTCHKFPAQYQAFENKINRIEQTFRDSFGYFAHLADFLSRLREIEYGLDVWWLTQNPMPENVVEEQIKDTIISQIQNSFKTYSKAACPEQDKIVSYSLHELDPLEHQKIEDHLIECRACLDLVLDLNIAEAEAKELHRTGEELKPFSEVVGVEIAIASSTEPKTGPNWHILLKDLGKNVIEQIKEHVTSKLDNLVDSFDIFNKQLVPIKTLTRSSPDETYKTINLKKGGSIALEHELHIQFRVTKNANIYVLSFDSYNGFEINDISQIPENSYFNFPKDNQSLKLELPKGEDSIIFLVFEQNVKAFDQRFNLLKEKGIEYIQDVFPDATVKIIKYKKV